MKNSILDHLSGGHTTFAGLSKALGNPKGDNAIALPNDPNIILWTNMSDAYADAVRSLWLDGLIKFGICSPISAGIAAYEADGTLLQLPLVTEQAGGDRSPCWLPVMIGGVQ